MTILTNTEIAALVSAQRLIVDFDAAQLQPASYDLRIGTVFKGGEIINKAHRNGSKPIVIKPGEVVTMLTREELHLPDDIAGTAYAMNSQSSEGLLVLNPGHVDPGYKGPLSMVALNLRKVDLPLLLDDPIFTLVFDKLQVPANPAYRNTSTSRVDRERKTNRQVIEKSMVSVGDLIALNSPFVTERRVKEIVLKHWLTWIIGWSTLIAAIFAVLAVLHPSAPAPGGTPGSSVSSGSPGHSGPLVVIQAAPTTPAIASSDGVLGTSSENSAPSEVKPIDGPIAPANGLTSNEGAESIQKPASPQPSEQ